MTISNNWKLVPIHTIFKESDERCNNKTYELLSVTQHNGIVKQSNIAIKKDTSNDDKSKYKIVLKNSIAYNKMRMWQGAVGINEISDGIVSPAYIVINPKQELSTKFYYYFFKTKYMILQFGRYSYGLCDDMNSLRYDNFKNIEVPFPLLSEQKTIASFLDNKCEKIENYITQKTKQITHLKELKTAIINECVVKGLDKTATFKESGIEWLGKIPSHWRIAKLKWYARTESGGTPSSSNLNYYTNGTIPWIRTTDLNNGIMNDTPIKITEIALKNTACKIIKKDSVLVGMYGGGGTIGKNALIKFDTAVNQAICAIIPKKEINSRYLHYYIQFYRPHFMADAEGTRIDPNISQEIILNLKIPILSLEEQKQIVSHIEQKLDIIDKLIQKTTKEIDFVKEYKTSLIDEVVSGKRKV